MEIIWSSSAYIDNLENIEYLIDEWYLSIGLKYEKKVIEVESLLIKNPYLGQFDKDLGLNRILVVKQIYMLYEVKDRNIYVIRMWNNHRKPYW